MKKSLFSIAAIVATAFLSFAFTSCNNDDDMDMSKKTSSVITFENVVQVKTLNQSGTFNGKTIAPIQIGEDISFTFSAGKGQALMFATMYGNSKDWFFAPENPGIQLYKADGTPITGDVSSQIKLWDNGSKDSAGNAESANITMVAGVDASKLMKLELSYAAASSEFTLKITNISGNTANNKTGFSPGVWAVSNVFAGNLLNTNPFFTAGQKTNPEMTALSQMGDNSLLAAKATENTAVVTGLSPAIVVVYTGDKNPIYQLGQKDAGVGLKELSQMGDASVLKASLSAMPNVKGVYVAGNTPVAPGNKVQVQFEAAEGDHIAYATMFGYSNDWFIANEATISAQFKGTVTDAVIFDNGTALDQYPGAGNAQALFSGAKQTMESLAIMKLDGKYPVPATDKILKIIIQ